MALQGERTRGGFILITGIDGTRYAVRQQAITASTMPTSAGTKRWSSYMVGTLRASPARSMKCWAGSYRGPHGPLLCGSNSALGAGDFVRLEFVRCGHDELIPRIGLVVGLRLPRP
jgi:hypothetical protein